MKKAFAITAHEQIIFVLESVSQILPASIGIYLYGSAVLSALRPDSDLDLLIFTDRPLTSSNREHLTKKLLRLSGRPYSYKRPVELSVVNRHDIAPWHFPPRFEYMYGEWLREDMEHGYVPQPFADPDNAVLLWQARMHSLPLTDESPAIESFIPPIPFSEIRRSIREALPNLLASLKGDERNVLLTLSRMWYTAATRELTSKDNAALWAESRVPEPFAVLLAKARNAYLGDVVDDWTNVEPEVSQLCRILRDQILKEE